MTNGEVFLYTIRRLAKNDLDCTKRIHELIAIEAEKNHMLLRSLTEIQERISKGQVVVAFVGKTLVGNCFFHSWSEDLVEICSLVVDERFRRRGIGTSLIEYTTYLAQKLYPKAKIFCLTDTTERPDRAVERFLAVGFERTKKNALPNEVWKWCEIDRCPDWLAGKFPDCKCLAMVCLRQNKKAEGQGTSRSS